ncbi:SH3 domain-containing protein [Xanthobacter tagetidis]|uniref:SH3 domain-containing protein n=1 Tax=Xanthobacter tagetidis TaxID=60216 RepID=A0A3L7A2M1_9HYPH|nr:SH3 domain-containing protein [Xanthobacter tagetidis]MBB6309295.1 uncharacterized protein YraI [Xanthobacter tagetidis]RLP74248.1 SH3 domain-containing protein [Xanthobacter tagetidis]
MTASPAIRRPPAGHVACGLLAGVLAVMASLPASAQSRCRAADPTGTPLNVRSGPYGDILGQVKNGTLVRIEADATDGKGKTWAYVVAIDTGQPLGWVFRDYLACS